MALIIDWRLAAEAMAVMELGGLLVDPARMAVEDLSWLADDCSNATVWVRPVCN